MKGLRNAEMDLSSTLEQGILLKKLEYKSISSESNKKKKGERV
jgi:hypothetical protein